MVKHLKWMCRDLMIQATFWSTLLFSISHPHTHKYLVSNINANMMAIQGVMTSVMIIISNSSFNKWGDKIFKYFQHMCIAEIIAYGFALTAVGFGYISPTLYILIDIFAYGCITRNMICSGNRLRRIIYKNEIRERYDNSAPIANSAACIIGGLLALIPFPDWLPWIVMICGISVDNVFYLIIYKRAVK